MTDRPAPKVSLVNLPNALTVLRLILVPVFLLALFAEGGHDTTWRWIAWAVFALAAMVGDFLWRITEPVLRPIRSIMPNLGGIDISPVILILIIIFIQSVITRYIYPNVF